MNQRIAFQGEPGAYSHEACQKARPDMEAMPCRAFEDVIEAVRTGAASLAMLPVENTTYGRVADIHTLLPQSGLKIIGEAFVRVRISLMARKGVGLDDIRHVRAHQVLLPQAAGFLKARGSPLRRRSTARVRRRRLRSRMRQQRGFWPVRWPQRSMVWTCWLSISRIRTPTPRDS